MAQVQSAVNPITEKINRLFWTRSVDDFALLRLGREIAALRKVDERDYYMLKGMLHSVTHDYEESKKAHETSLFLRSTPVAVANFALSMMRANQPSEAVKVVLQGLKRHLGSDLLFKVAFDVCLFAGDLAAADEVVNQVRVSGGTFDLSANDEFQKFVTIRGKLKELGVPEFELANAVALAAKVCRDNGLYFIDASYQFDDYDGHPGVYIELVFPFAEAAEIAALDDAIADAMITSDLAHWSDIVIVATRQDFDENKDVA